MNLQVRRLSKDKAYINLKEKIIYGELVPDQDVQEEMLASLLEIGRTPLREALQKLESEGFLVRQPNGRLKVASISKKECEEIFLFRSMLEGFIARNAAKNATEQNIRQLTAILQNISIAFKVGLTQDYVSYGFEFHDYIAEISGLKVFAKQLNTIKDHAMRYNRFVSMYGKWNEKNDTEHGLIFERIKARDEDGAEQAMKEHIFNSLSIVLQNLDEK